MLPVFCSISVILELAIAASPPGNKVLPTIAVKGVEFFLKNERTTFLCQSGDYKKTEDGKENEEAIHSIVERHNVVASVQLEE